MTKEEKKRQEALEQYGQQGNEGQYGQGQYTLEGKPDPHGPQAQEIQSDVTETKNDAGRRINRDAYNRQNDLEQQQQKRQENEQQQGQKSEGMIQKGEV